jgi:hypothetical protein
MTTIYADFNALLDVGGTERPGLVRLDRMGTLRDLSAARLKLTEGLGLRLRSDSTEDEDLEVDAIVRWIANPHALDGGYWVAEFEQHSIRDVPIVRTRSVTEWFPCASCGTNLAAEFAQFGLDSSTRCSVCGARVHELIAPPSSA